MFNRGFLHFNKNKKTSDNKTIMKISWPDYVVTLDGKNFTEFITTYPVSLIDFWAPWCEPCKVMSPRLRRLSKIYAGEIAFGKLNIQIHQEIAKKYKIMGIPHFVIFKNGKQLRSTTGVKSVGDVKDILDDILDKLN